MDITMSRVCLASDTCDLYFSYIKVNHLLYTCSLDPFEDGILLDTPLVCMHRYCRSFTDDDEECKRRGTPTPSAREAWKRRRKKTERLKLQPPDIRRQPGHPAPARTSGDQPGHPTLQQRPDIRHHPGNPARATEAPEERPSPGRTSGPCPDIRPPMNGRTSGPQPGHPAPACAQSRARGPCILSHLPLHVLDYIYSSTSTILGLANVIAHFRLELCSS